MAPKIGSPAPAFKAQAVVDGQFKTVSLEDYKVRERNVFPFFPSRPLCFDADRSLASRLFLLLLAARASLFSPPPFCVFVILVSLSLSWRKEGPFAL